MEKTASQIQKERIKELEAKADALIAKCDVATLTSINEKGYPRTCALSIYKADGFSDIYFVTSKRSAINGKATHFEANPKASVCYFLYRSVFNKFHISDQGHAVPAEEIANAGPGIGFKMGCFSIDSRALGGYKINIRKAVRFGNGQHTGAGIPLFVDGS